MSERVFPSEKPRSERVTALSLLDATTANFGHASAVWLFEAPSRKVGESLNLGDHFRNSLQVALSAFPQWCGRLELVTSVDQGPENGLGDLPTHARRLGRVYCRYGTHDDPGFDFKVAKSDATLDTLHPPGRTSKTPIWTSDQETIKGMLPATKMRMLRQTIGSDEKVGDQDPIAAAQLTLLACGGFALGVQACHPLADITSLVHFLQGWAKASRSLLGVAPTTPPLPSPVFDPGRLDTEAAGDINLEEADAETIKVAKSLPFERYDWWAASTDKTEPSLLPPALQGQYIAPAGNPMPWSQWDREAPVSHRIIHFTKSQIGHLVRQATSDSTSNISQHDAILSHVWSCIVRARDLSTDDRLVHCNLVYGVRPLFNLRSSFMGSPIVMANVELPGSKVADPSNAGIVAQKVRETLKQIGDPASMAAHLHSLAYEKTPQRIWQAFLGQRNILVTTWARAGAQDVDFGLGAGLRYVDGVIPLLDGNVLIKEGPPPAISGTGHGDSQEVVEKKRWTDDGVDVALNLAAEDMERLLADPLLLPKV